MSRSISTEDRISALPDSIICHILSFVPTKTAAITSILSKRWNPLWLSVLVLHFDNEAFQNFVSFCHFVYSVFLLRDITLPLRSFHLICSKASGIQQQDINQFVHAAAQRGIENLNLELSGMITLPRSIFSCRTLVVLHLKWITVKDLSQLVVDFPLLKKLHLSGVLLERAEYIIQLLSGCPILEELQAERLIVNNMEGLVSLKFVLEKFRSLPKLITANITKSTHSLTLLLIFLCRKSQLLRAELDTRHLKCFKFRNLTNMELILKHNHCEKWNCLLEGLTCCPNLQNLTVHQDFENGEEVVDNWVDPANIPECLSTQLKTCLLKGYKCTDSELQFAKYIMQNAKVLKTMSIKSASSIDTNAKYQNLMKLASWTRASSTCKLLFD